MLKKGEHYLNRFAASKLVAQSNYLQNNKKILACKIKALLKHY